MKKMILPLVLILSLLASCSGEAAPASRSVSAGALSYTAFPDLSGYTVTDPAVYKAGEPEVKGDRDNMKLVNFYRDDIRIHGELYLPEGDGPFPIVIVSSGQTAPYSVYIDEAMAFSESGFACLVFDSIGAVGRSTSGGELTDSSVLTEVQDLNVILDSLPKLPKVDKDKVFLFGHSIGGLVDIIAGAGRPADISGMILLEPAVTYPDYTRENTPDLADVPDFITDVSKYNTLVGKQFVIDMCSVDVMKEAAGFDKDVLMILGTADKKASSSPSSAALYPKAFKTAGKAFPSCETFTVQGADHLFQGEYGEKAVEKSIDFINGHI